MTVGIAVDTTVASSAAMHTLRRSPMTTIVRRVSATRGPRPPEVEQRPRVAGPGARREARLHVARAARLEEPLEEAKGLDRGGLLGRHAHVVGDRDLRLVVEELGQDQRLEVEV